MTWFQIWTVCWQVTIVLAPILIGAAVLWLASRFVSRAEFEAYKARNEANAIAEKTRLDAEIAKATTAAGVETNRVNAEFTAVRAEMRAEIATVRGDCRAEVTRLEAELKRRKDESDTRYEHVRDCIADHQGRIKAVESEQSRPPTRHQLNTEVTKVIGSNLALEKSIAGIVKQFETAVGGIAKQLETNNSYLQVLIENGMVKS